MSTAEVNTTPAINRPRAKEVRRPGRPKGSVDKKTIEMRNEIVSLTAEQKVMTVRGVYYALTTRGVIPKDDRGYRACGRVVLEMRRAGLLSWEFISDATRWMRKPISHNTVDDAITEMSRSYRRNLWQSQRRHAEVWLEKDALAGVVMEATEFWDVPLMVSRGTPSATYIYQAARDIGLAWERAGIKTTIFGLYDFDAGGERAYRTVKKQLREFVGHEALSFERLAVTAEQVKAWNLPTRPAKKSDPEAAKFGDEAVELDAIPPDRLIGLVSAAIEGLVDPRAWEIQQLAEDEERRGLVEMFGGAR